MKKNIHPNWHHDCIVTCSCGNSFTTGSGSKAMQVDICEKCHPFFTGEMRFVDRQGRVDKFMQKMKVAQQKQAAQKTGKKKKTQSNQDDPQSYQQILRDQQKVLRKVAKAKQSATSAGSDDTASAAK